MLQLSFSWLKYVNSVIFTYLQEIDSDTYLCKNCEYKQHQCFKCGELEPSDEPNAKVTYRIPWKNVDLWYIETAKPFVFVVNAV